jgi:hypothetical protein
MYRLVRTLVLAGVSLAALGLIAAQPMAAQQPAERTVAAHTEAPAKADPAGTVDTPRCPAEHELPETDRWDWKWRLLAYRHLDCLVAKVDSALAAESGSVAGRSEGNAAGTIAMRKEDLEQIRALAWSARDAAARIGL